jgi:hypothetical protein
MTHTLSHHIMRKNSLKSPYLDIRYQHKAKIKEESSTFLLSSLNCSQIWLSPLTNLEKEEVKVRKNLLLGDL